MFQTLDSSTGDADALLNCLARELVAAGRFHELFDARLMQRRQRLGLALDRRGSLDELPEPLRSKTESAYLDACREVGQLLLEAGRFREAWIYLRPVGDKGFVRAAMAKVVPDDDNIEELIEVALYEGVDPERGFAWLLGHRGTCHSITELDSLAGQLSPADQCDCATILTRHLHAELIANVQADIEERKGVEEGADEREGADEHDKVEERQGGPPETAMQIRGPLLPSIENRPWLFYDENYHVDTSHLAATVRFARLVEAPDILQLALDLTEYGRRLARSLQYKGVTPFVDVFPSHRLFFTAMLGEQIDEAVRFFARCAAETSIEEDGTAAIETYLILLARIGRPADALEAFARLAPRDAALSVYAPTPLELARASGHWPRYLEIVRARDDALGYAAGLVEMRTDDAG